MAGAEQVVLIATVNPLTVTIPGDKAGVRVPVRNLTGLTLSVNDKVKLSAVTRGGYPEIVGRAS